MFRFARWMRKALGGVAILGLVLGMASLAGCGQKAEEEKQAEGYYEGPMQPKSERVGIPGQQSGQ